MLNSLYLLCQMKSMANEQEKWKKKMYVDCMKERGRSQHQTSHQRWGAFRRDRLLSPDCDAPCTSAVTEDRDRASRDARQSLVLCRSTCRTQSQASKCKNLWRESIIFGEIQNQVTPKTQHTIVHSLIPRPQTFSDLFYLMNFCEETVLCNKCATHLLSKNVFGLRIWGV